MENMPKPSLDRFSFEVVSSKIENPKGRANHILVIILQNYLWIACNLEMTKKKNSYSNPK